MTASMIWRWIGASGVAIVLAGCAAITDVPIALSILQSPVRWGGSTGLVNAPLSAEERCRLSRIGEDIRRGQPRGVAVDSWSMSVASRPGVASWPTAASYGHLPTSLPESTCTRGARTNYDRSLTEYVDTFEDLIDKDPIVLVAVSGGGARAASLAASTMSTLERSYNQVAAKLGIEKPRPFFRHVDVYSGVSGGSIYLYSVMVSTSLLDMRDRLHLRDRSGIATKQDASLNCRSDTGITDPFAAFERCFYFAHRSTRDRLYDIGLHSAARYLPFNIVNTLFTDAGYFDVLTLGLGQASKSSSPIWRDSGGWLGNALEALVPFPYPPTLGMLSKRPRVLFNTTALETGLP